MQEIINRGKDITSIESSINYIGQRETKRGQELNNKGQVTPKRGQGKNNEWQKKTKREKEILLSGHKGSKLGPEKILTLKDRPNKRQEITSKR